MYVFPNTLVKKLLEKHQTFRLLTAVLFSGDVHNLGWSISVQCLEGWLPGQMRSHTRSHTHSSPLKPQAHRILATYTNSPEMMV